MCDASDILQSSALIWTLSLIPAKIFPYLALGLLSASFIICALRHNCPAIYFKPHCISAGPSSRYPNFTSDCWRHATCQAGRSIFATIFVISRALAMLEREVRDIQTSLLVLIEAAHQRKLTADLQAGQEIGDGVLQP
ncbi:hypothetical protein B0H14DRAFT_2635923 [Mycena olivaceomarginata]|nr:hypothetical protein B0H14DRAFT_2635923 [Mycena olivaceomarginata]